MPFQCCERARVSYSFGGNGTAPCDCPTKTGVRMRIASLKCSAGALLISAFATAAAGAAEPHYSGTSAQLIARQATFFADEPAATPTGGARSVAYSCYSRTAQLADGTDTAGVAAAVLTTVPKEEVLKQWLELTKGPVEETYCYTEYTIDLARQWIAGFSRNIAINIIPFTPKASEAQTSGPEQTAVVVLASPAPEKGERGFAGLAFDVKYRFIVCQGELHIAYSLVEDSVRPRPDSTLPPTYVLDGKYHSPTQLPTHIASVPISGTVSTRSAKLIGRFGDNFAAKALGFGCFTGQTQKLGNMKEYLPQNATEAQTKDFLNTLEAFIKTTEIYQSAQAEDEIRTFLRDHPGEKTFDPTSVTHAQDVSRDRAKAAREAQAAAEEERQQEEARAVRAQYEATRKRQEEFARQEQERLDAYNRQVEEHRKALAENQRQVAAAAEAQRQFEEKQAQYERERAAWEAQTKRGK